MRKVWTTVVLAVTMMFAPVVNATGDASITATVTISQITVDLDLPSTSVRAGERFQARAIATNVGSVDVPRVVMTLRYSPLGIVVKGGADRVVRRLRPTRSSTVWWVACASLSGTYIVVASATVDEISIDSPGRLLTISGDGACA